MTRLGDENTLLHRRLAGYQKALELLYTDTAVLQLRNSDLTSLTDSLRQANNPNNPRDNLDLNKLSSGNNPNSSNNSENGGKVSELEKENKKLRLQVMTLNTQVLP